MRLKIFLLSFAVAVSFILTGCYTHPNDVGRVKKDTFKEKQRDQEELIRRQNEVILRQERELQNIERQRIYNRELERFKPVE